MLQTKTLSAPAAVASWRQHTYGLIAAEISRLARYCDRVIQFCPSDHDDGLLLESIDCADKQIVTELPDLTGEQRETTLVLLNGNANHCTDLEQLLSEMKSKLSRTSRVCLVAYNPYMRFAFSAADRLGLRRGPKPETYLTRVDLENIARLSGFEVCRLRPAMFVPHHGLGIGTVLNRWLPAIPGLRALAFTNIITLRPIIAEADDNPPSLSVVIPARNERGNIRSALDRLEPYRAKFDLQVIFVEGHSNDGTWEEIEAVREERGEAFQLKCLQQSGKGKADAVRLGFSHADKDLVTILDADLTMPPELLGRFYDAYCRGLGDFINGSRLVYPMEGEAMRFLNRIGNGFFAKVLSATLGTRLGDSLCGTKLLRRSDYARMVRWRHDFGDFDPFGDFELLFPAATLALGVIDVPVRYRARTYGSTNINRFRHGMVLLQMTATGLWRITRGSSR